MKQVKFVHFGASIAQLGERQTEDLKVPGSIPGRGNFNGAVVTQFVKI